MIQLILKILLPVVLVIGGFFGFQYLAAQKEPPAEPEARDEAPLVRVRIARPRAVRLSFSTYGSVRPQNEVSIAPQVTGRVTEISPNLLAGGFLKKDEVLFRIERRDYELAKTQAVASVAQAKARLEREQAEALVAKQEWEEFGKGKASALVLREPQMAEMRALLSSAEARRDRAELDLERTEVRCPMNARVRSESVDVGQVVAAGIPLAMVYATDAAEVRLAIPDDRIPTLDLPLFGGKEESSLPVRLTATLAGREYYWDGEIVRVEAEVDARTRVVHAIARVEKPFARSDTGRPPLMVGMYVKALIPGRRVEGLVPLPARAVEGGTRVLVVDAENRIQVRQVEVMRADGAEILVRRGLLEGERVCVTRLDNAVSGMRVRVAAGGER